MNILRKHRKSNKKKRLSKYILFIFTLIMTTFAWIAYSRVLNTHLNLHIAAWDMEYYIGTDKMENPIGINFPTLYPQMPEQMVVVDIKNNGEALVDLDYYIQEISIVGVKYELIYEGEVTKENQIKIEKPALVSDEETGELLARGIIINDPERFPFTLEIEHSLQVIAQDDGYLKVTANWIGDNDELDTEWGYTVGDYFAKNPTASSAMSIMLSIDSYQADEEILGGVGNLPNGPGTRPYLPSSDFTQVEGTSLETGLAIKDLEGNEYVWIEVPKLASIYGKDNISIKEFTDTEYAIIENALQTYASTYRSGATDTYYSDTATGLSSSEYTDLKKKMLKSVYQNGGFYIGRYEAGTDTSRTSSSTISGVIPKSQANQIPLNWVTCSEAQTLANKASTNGYTGSLMFGLQWDLVEKYIETKAIAQGIDRGTIQYELNEKSTGWGNYKSSKYTITNTNAKYYPIDTANDWLQDIPYNKLQSNSVVLTTGAIDAFEKQNIFDLAGNVWEWTLEYSNVSNQPCVLRGGAYESSDALEINANSRSNNTDIQEYNSIGFRVTIF